MAELTVTFSARYRAIFAGGAELYLRGSSGNISACVRIFISYAHEDLDFAMAVAAGLRQFYEVWIDQDKILAGDSIFAAINHGLATCDFAVVILSPHFVSKTWTQRELGGLFAIEEHTKKLILFVWKNISSGEVKKFAPMLADRAAIKAEEGIEAVVAKLRVAIDGAGRAVELQQKPDVVARFQKLGRDLKVRADADLLLQSVKGVKLIATDYEQLIERVQGTLQRAETETLKFTIQLERGVLLVHTRARLTMRIQYVNGFQSDAKEAELHVGIFRRSGAVGPFASPERPVPLTSMTFKPRFVGEQVVWTLSENKSLTADQTIEHMLELFLEHISRASN